MVTPTGFEPIAVSADESTTSTPTTPARGTCGGLGEQKQADSVHGNAADLPPDLAEIVAAWPHLPADTRQAILDLTRKTSTGKQ